MASARPGGFAAACFVAERQQFLVNGVDPEGNVGDLC